MIELTWIPGAMRALVWVYLGLGIAALLAALIRPKTATAKAGWTFVVVLAFGLIPLLAERSVREDKNVAKAGQERLQQAMARYQERCKSAGEKINRTVENVDGVVWMKWRPKEGNDSDQFKLDDPYGRDCGGEDCILQLLRVSKGADLNPEVAKRHSKGYRYVESTDPEGRLLRYAAAIKSVRQRTPEQREQYKKNSDGIDPGLDIYDVALESQPIDKYTARYGITWDDISAREDRQHWIASGSLKVMDMQDNEVIAERVGHLIDRGQGSTAGFRAPWPWARSYGPSCPSVRDRSADFVTKVLKPTTN